MVLGSNPGPDPRQGPAFWSGFYLGLFIVFCLAVVVGFDGFSKFGGHFVDETERYISDRAYYKRRLAEYEKEMAAWPAELERRRASNALELARRAEVEKEKRIADAEIARQWQARSEAGRRYREAEAERQRQEALKREHTAALKKAWEDAYAWAVATLETEYHGFKIQLVATHGPVPDEDVLKLFAVAYPHLGCSTDWRMGCLRERAPYDPRVAAILPHLSPPDAQNMRPT